MNRIDGFNPLSTSRTSQGGAAVAVEADAQNRAGGSDGGEGVTGLDRVSLSSRGRTVADAARLVNDAPDTRADRVAQLKAAIADGTYASNPRDIAARLLAAGLGD